jgi:hypothetical protein
MHYTDIMHTSTITKRPGLLDEPKRDRMRQIDWSCVTVADVGCGHGWSTVFFGDPSDDVTAY